MLDQEQYVDGFRVYLGAWMSGEFQILDSRRHISRDFCRVDRLMIEEGN